MFTSLHSSEPKSSARAASSQGKTAPFFQAKLTVNTPGDAHEREADQVADQVMRMREGDAPIVQRMPLAPVSGVMRACAECEKEKMQRKETSPTPALPSMGGSMGDASGKTAPSVVSDVLSSGGGQPMESGTRQFMESRFGQDFSQVRIHTDSRAAESASAIQARAYTSGRDVVFGAGEYQPSSEGGKRLLAHELVHVGQQGKMQNKIEKNVTTQQEVETNGLRPGDEDVPNQKTQGSIFPLIQRSTVWDPVTVHESINLSEMILFGGAPVTWHMLNGVKVTSDAAAEGAIKSPTIVTSGSGTNWKAVVSVVALNKGSDDESVLTKGPWSTVTTKGIVGSKISKAVCTGKDPSTFSAKGKPSDEAVYKANRRHEDHHVADDIKAFNETIGEWDKKLETAKTAKTEFSGISTVDATAKLYTAMGGTPKDVARAYNASSLSKGAAFHGTPKGGKMSTSNSTSNADCSVASIEVTNPS